MATERVQRGLAAVLAGFGRLMRVDEDGALAQLRAHRRDLIDFKIIAHRGRIVNTAGDGLLVKFSSVLLSKALSFSYSAVVSTDSSCSSFATCRVIVSSMTRLPAAAGAISLPRRSHRFLVYDDGEPRELHGKAGFVA